MAPERVKMTYFDVLSPSLQPKTHSTLSLQWKLPRTHGFLDFAQILPQGGSKWLAHFLPISCLRGSQNGLPNSCPFLASGGSQNACYNFAHFLPARFASKNWSVRGNLHRSHTGVSMYFSSIASPGDCIVAAGWPDDMTLWGRASTSSARFLSSLLHWCGSTKPQLNENEKMLSSVK